MRPLALKWRLSGLMAIALAMAILIMCVVVYQETRELLRKQTDESLLAWARAAEEVVSDSASVSSQSEKLSLLFLPAGRHTDMLARIWREETGQLIHSRAPRGATWNVTLSSLPKPGDGHSRFFSTSFAGRAYRGIWLRTAHGQPTSIVIAQTTAEVESEVAELLRDLVSIGTSVVAAMVGVVFLLVRAGLRPIQGTARQLTGIDARNLAQVHIEAQRVPVELAPFVQSLRQMLERLDESMRRQKAFIADASHELRTPVAVAKSTIQTTLAENRSSEHYRLALAENLEDLRRM